VSDERESRQAESARSGGPSEALKAAVERTFAATAGSVEDTRERASELLDEVVRRGQQASQEVVRRGQEAGEEVARRGAKAREAVTRHGQEARDEIIRRIELELGTISDRLESLETALRRSPGGDDEGRERGRPPRALSL